MKKAAVLASSLALSLLVAALVGCEPKNTAGVDTKDKDKTPTMTEAQYIERGRYIANTSECLACHTPIRPLTDANGAPIIVDGKPVIAPDFEKARLAGGNAWLTPGAGIGVSPNLTPYPGSDIATLSPDDLADKWKTIKEGQLLPPMPGLEKYEREDLKALAYYFKSVDPVTDQPPKTYYFKGKSNNDNTWPVPGWLKDPSHPAAVAADHKGGVIPGNLEVSQAPFLTKAISQELINENIAEANK